MKSRGSNLYVPRLNNIEVYDWLTKKPLILSEDDILLGQKGKFLVLCPDEKGETVLRSVLLDERDALAALRQPLAFTPRGQFPVRDCANGLPKRLSRSDILIPTMRKTKQARAYIRMNKRKQIDYVEIAHDIQENMLEKM